MKQHYKDSENNVYGYKPKGIDVTPITMDEVRAIAKSKVGPEQKISEIESQRKSEEDKGVTINNVRYSGSEKNRSALQEAINYLKDSGGTAFPVWKDSDNEYHVDHPLKDVEDALRAIGVRRMALIAKESEHVQSVLDGTIDNTDNLDWSV